MAYFYMDTDTGSDANDGTTWALGKLTLEGLIAVMSAGDIGVIQGIIIDTASANRTFTSPGTDINPCMFIGVKNGTTNTGTSIITSDLVARGDADMPHIQVTGAGINIYVEGFAHIYGIKISTSDRFYASTPNSIWEFSDSILDLTGLLYMNGGGLVFNNSELLLTSISTIYVLKPIGFVMKGGILTIPTSLFARVHAPAYLIGVDLSASNIGALQSWTNSGEKGNLHLKNCKMPATYALVGSTQQGHTQFVELIGCSSNTSAKGDTTSYQDYEYEDGFGTIDLEATVVRKDGANYGASGSFA